MKKTFIECYKDAEEHGWHETVPDFGTLLMLIVSEAAEALEDFRNHLEPNKIHYDCQAANEIERCTMGPGNYCKDCRYGKPCGIPTELADIVIRTADVAGILKIDLAEAIEEKMKYNKTRPYRHGGKKV